MPKIFNRQTLLERVDGDEELINELLGIFMQQVPQQLRELEEALQTGDTNELQCLAHSLKGVAASICAEAIRQVAGELEQAGKNRDMGQAAIFLKALIQEFDRFQEVIGLIARNGKSMANHATAAAEIHILHNPGEPILVVDDDLVQHTLIKKYLRDWQIVHAYSAEEALNIVQQENILLVVTDLHMSEMDGLELLRRIKCSKSFVQVIVISASEDLDDLIRVLEAGANDFLLKPLDKQALEDALENALSRIHRWQQSLNELFQSRTIQ